MSTMFVMNVGYSAHTHPDHIEEWAELVSCVGRVTDYPYIMEGRCQRMNPPDDPKTPLIEYAKQYRAEKGNPLSIDHHQMTVSISCSGGDPSRTIKEKMAAGFCQLVMTIANERGVMVNLVIS